MWCLKLFQKTVHDFYLELQRSYNILRLLDRHSKQCLEIGRHCFLKRCNFGIHNKIYDNCYLVDISLGDRTYISEECRMYDVTLGKFCAIGPHVTMGLGIHPSRTFVSIHPLLYSKTNSACMDSLADRNYFTEHKSIQVGHDVWIGANVIVQDGVIIGNGAIIGSGAVVTKDIPPYSLAAGVPAKILRFRFEPSQISFLEEFCWWNKNTEWLTYHWRDFHDIKLFMQQHSDKNHYKR
ncbi:MAG: CatB-related O-acetyltransferase [Desulfobacteraceae bacterium]|nr:CatB-related O-acetyltransferase [Desulfobacteraceae bacterium]